MHLYLYFSCLFSSWTLILYGKDSLFPGFSFGGSEYCPCALQGVMRCSGDHQYSHCFVCSQFKFCLCILAYLGIRVFFHFCFHVDRTKLISLQKSSWYMESIYVCLSVYLSVFFIIYLIYLLTIYLLSTHLPYICSNCFTLNLSPPLLFLQIVKNLLVCHFWGEEHKNQCIIV